MCTYCLFHLYSIGWLAGSLNLILVPRVRVTLDQRSGTRDSGIKRLPENKNPVIGQTAQASGIRTSGFTKCSHYSTRQLSFPWKN